MSSNENTGLADCELQARNLVEEITKYRSASALSDQTARSLKSLCEALQETAVRIRPFTDVVSRRVLYGAASLLTLNFLASLVAIVLLLRR